MACPESMIGRLGITSIDAIFDRATIEQLKSVPYLGQSSLGEYLDNCRDVYPFLYERLDPSRFCGDHFNCFRAELKASSSHFESENEGGRGDTYRKAQNRNPLFRAQGIKTLFQLLQRESRRFSPSDVVLDMLGGNGTFTRAIHSLEPQETIPMIVTSDVSAMMISDALSQSLPAIRQPAQRTLLQTESVDGVMFAYGTHHIPPMVRLDAFKEACRLLKPRHKIVVQDFESETPTARWYSDLLDRYTNTGHKFDHFTREDLRDLVQNAGLVDVQIADIYDPFVVYASEPESARRHLVEHACSLFGLQKLISQEKSIGGWKEIEQTMRPYGVFSKKKLPLGVNARCKPSVRKVANGYAAEFPRVALVAIATKP